MLLVILLCLEFVLRLVLEVRECRAVQARVNAFTLMRLIPLVNDIVPLPGAGFSKAAKGSATSWRCTRKGTRCCTIPFCGTW